MDFSQFKETLSGILPGITPAQWELFGKMDPLYRDWNSKINVISRKDIDGLYPHHIIHSLAIEAYLRKVRPEETFGAKVLDLGTGGGFPGIPLAVMHPETEFVLCDSVGKKTIVASAVASELGLRNVRVVNDRAENLHETFDTVVSRAVASLGDFYPWVKGRFSKRILYLKGGDVVEEISTLMARYRMRSGQVGTWQIRSWYDDEYFDGKLVIDIGK